MTDLRAARTEIIRRHYRRLCDSLTEALPALLDALEALDQAELATGGNLSPELAAAIEGEPAPESRAPTDAELTAWIEAHPAEFAAWQRKQARIEGRGETQPALSAPASRSQARRRAAQTGRKEA